MQKKSRMIPHSKPTFSSSDKIAVQDLMESGMVAEGEKCNDFQGKLKSMFDCPEVVLTNTGSSALFYALKLLHGGKKKIVLPTYVCKDVIESVLATGLIPVLCDVDGYWNIGCDTISKVIDNDTAAIILPHNLGIAANIEEISKFGITVIEDCCQSFGGQIDGRLLGTWGDLTVLSFNATKCLTTGEGGAVLINNKSFLEDSKKLNGLKHILRMSDLQAVLGLNQLNNYEAMLESRRRIASIYFKEINKDLISHFESIQSRSMFFRFLLFGIDSFEDFKAYMQENGVAVRRGIDRLLHWDYKMYDKGEFPNARFYFDKTASIPIYPSLKDHEAKIISGLVNEYYNAN